jgi:pimeloyl-ACP methyl ester carboxylesterase
MYVSTITALAVLAASVSAKQCINTTVPVNLTARQAVFNLDVPQTNLEATDFILDMTQQGRNFTDLVLTGYNTTTGTYNISTQFCMPSNDNSTSPTVQVLTHGIGFDKTWGSKIGILTSRKLTRNRYWDLSFNNYNYSYVNVATDQYKYCTLSFDRLGIGNSSHGEPLNEIQSFIEIAATVQLTQMLRNGSFPGVNHTFSKVVHVGHSFGSAQTYALANMYPNTTDGIVLTGFSMNGSFVSPFVAGGNFQQANQNQPLRFSNITGLQALNALSMYAEPLVSYISPIDLSALPAPQALPNGYLITSDIEGNKLQFFKPHYYDPAILELVERTKQPVTEGELLTLASLPMMNNFAGPVMLISGGQ